MAHSVSYTRTAIGLHWLIAIAISGELRPWLIYVPTTPVPNQAQDLRLA
jgi:cytochrome b561